MSIAVMGAGSLGIVVGAGIAATGADVVLVDADGDNVTALNAGGARIVGSIERTVPVRAITPDQMSGTYDVVILLIKQTYNEIALATLLPFLREDSVVCTLQNGIPEPRVGELVGRDRIMGGSVGFGATWVGPGISMLTSTSEVMERFAFEIGEIDGRRTQRAQQVATILSGAGHCEVINNLMAVRWSKLLMNATFSGVSTALACTFGDVLNDPSAMAFLAQVADEVIRVAEADGHGMAPMQGEDFGTLRLGTGQTVSDKMPLYHRVWDRHALLRASMLQDLEKGRPTEIDFINGHVAAIGRRRGVATPFNDLVVEVVRCAQRGGTVPHRATTAARMADLIRQAELTG